MKWREIYSQQVNMNFQNAVQIDLKPVLFYMLFLSFICICIFLHIIYTLSIVILYMVSINCNFIWFIYIYIAGKILNF